MQVVTFRSCEKHAHLDTLSLCLHMNAKLRRAGGHPKRWECSQCGRRNNVPARPLVDKKATETPSATVSS